MDPKDVVESRHSDLGDFAPPEEEIIQPADVRTEADDQSDFDFDDLADLSDPNAGSHDSEPGDDNPHQRPISDNKAGG